MTINLKVSEVREMLNEASRFSADLHILAEIEKAIAEVDPKKKAILKEKIVRSSTNWAPREFQPSQLDILFNLANEAIILRAMENVGEFQSKFGIAINGLPWE